MSSRRDWDGTRGPRLRKVASLPLRLSLSLSLSPLERPRLSFESGRRRALRLGLPAPNGFSPCCLRVSQSRWSRSFLSRLRGGSLRSRSILSPALLCAQPDPFEFSKGTPNQEDLWRFEDRKKGEHPSIHDEGHRFGARLWFGNETPKRIPPPYTLFVLFLKRFLLYKSFSN